MNTYRPLAGLPVYDANGWIVGWRDDEAVQESDMASVLAFEPPTTSATTPMQLVEGCMNPDAVNFNPLAEVNSEPCIIPQVDCENEECVLSFGIQDQSPVFADTSSTPTSVEEHQFPEEQDILLMRKEMLARGLDPWAEEPQPDDAHTHRAAVPRVAFDCSACATKLRSLDTAASASLLSTLTVHQTVEMLHFLIMEPDGIAKIDSITNIVYLLPPGEETRAIISKLLSGVKEMKALNE
ncbi:hypothetical protein CYMTET_21328 [Cymbomonas tetramitiformis]|uniref:Uncharacterized protein n=1 Tax=Cymbomonas tetramitiformis TaxID=36881 RepID=A0AAE0G2F5_9CHLO|nr:hypothetical protein CYMTET_21328 [Cymbomonas tetramitiformis]